MYKIINYIYIYILYIIILTYFVKLYKIFDVIYSFLLFFFLMYMICKTDVYLLHLFL